ncbi:unnamed protein product [Linum trigynum]|uniref:Uncharacterized protein n=1 Tax=Linum trigynum TaxID=586398 RepID=A0AAV2CKH6_9ROSI
MSHNVSEQASFPSHLNASSPFSLDLLCREFVMGSRHQDYQSLIAARLRYDLANIQSTSDSNLTPLHDDDSQQPPLLVRFIDLGRVRVEPGQREYFSPIGLGIPTLLHCPRHCRDELMEENCEGIVRGYESMVVGRVKAISVDGGQNCPSRGSSLQPIQRTTKYGLYPLVWLVTLGRRNPDSKEPLQWTESFWRA